MKSFFLLAIVSSISVAISASSALAQEPLTCGPDSGVWSCTRDTQSDLMPGNHNYLWDARNAQSCGTSGNSGSGNTGLFELGPAGDSCNFVPFSEGKEDEVMQHCQENANNGVWVPFFNDCHNAVKDSVENSGLVNPDVPGGRLGAHDYQDSESPLWRDSDVYTDDYGYDSDGDGILDQSRDANDSVW